MHELERLQVVVRLADLRLASDHVRVGRREHRAVDGGVRQQAVVQHVQRCRRRPFGCSCRTARWKIWTRKPCSVNGFETG